MTLYIVSAIAVLIFSGLLAMAGLGAAFLFVPLFYYLGVSLAEATPAALLLNVVNLIIAVVNYRRGKLINWRVSFPALIAAVILSPIGARPTQFRACTKRICSYPDRRYPCGHDGHSHSRVNA